VSPEIIACYACVIDREDDAALALQRFSGDFNDDFGACVKIYVQIEWEFPRMCENWR
jgi:hypothetical protein